MSESQEQQAPPKKMDPGWNDPPMLNYSASNPPPKSRITNKRVAFPLNNSPAVCPDRSVTQVTNSKCELGPPKLPPTN